MSNLDSEMSEALAPPKDTVYLFEESYTRYCARVQKFYILSLTKPMITLLGILILISTSQLHLRCSNLFVYVELLWILVPVVIRSRWTPYSQKMLSIVLVCFVGLFLAFLSLTCLFFINFHHQTLFTFFLWAICLAMYFPLLVHLIWIWKLSHRVTQLETSVKTLIAGKLKPIKECSENKFDWGLVKFFFKLHHRPKLEKQNKDDDDVYIFN